MLTELNVEAAELHLLTGKRHEDQGQLQEAFNSYQRALASYTNYAPAYLAIARMFLSQGQPERAIPALTQVDQLQPELIDAELHAQLARVLTDRNAYDAAIPHWQKAIALQPNNPDLRIQFGNTLLKRGNPEEAIAIYKEALSLNINHIPAYLQLSQAFQQAALLYQQRAFDLQPELAPVDTHFNLGLNFAEQGQPDLAIRAYQRAVHLKPDWAEAHCNLGNLYSAKGQLDEAIASLKRAVALNPNFIEALSNLGNAYAKQGDLDSALNYHQKAIALRPNWAELHFNLADAYAQHQRFDDALPLYYKALEFKPELAEAHFGLGKAFVAQNQFAQAIPHLKQTITLRPNWGDAYYFLGRALLNANQHLEAIAAYEQAVRLVPSLLEARWDLGITCWQLDRLGDAIAAFESILDLQPNLPDVHLNICVLRRVSGDFANARLSAERYAQTCGETDPLRVAVTQLKVYLESGLYDTAREKLNQIEEMVAAAKDDLAEPPVRLIYEDLLFSLPYLRDSVKANSAICRTIGKQYGEKPLSFITPPTKEPKPRADHLKIAILSKHFRRHSVGWCSLGIIQELAKLTSEIHLYSTTTRLAIDDHTQKFREITPHFYEWSEQFPNQAITPPALIDQIAQHEFDVLLEMDSVMNPIHASVLKARPASMCVSWLGCEAPYISDQNYYLGDWHSHPETVDQFYREKLLRMPHSGVAIAGFESLPIDREAVRQSLGIKPEQTVFLSVSTGHKMNPDTVKATVEILQRVPDSLFIHKGFADTKVLQQQFETECDRQNIDKLRVKFLPRTRQEEEHRSYYHIADILLDTYPYNGGTHNLEALWFNLPLVIRKGEQGPSRLGYSFLYTLEIESGIATTWEEYVDWGVKMGKETDLRTAIRERLMQSKDPANLSPLWNCKQFAQDMYSLFCKTLAD